MIYLIGGPPRCGKTTVARGLGERLRCPVIQTDHLGAMISRYVPEAEYGQLRPAVESMALDNDLRYSVFSAMEVVDHYRGRAAVAWPGLQALIEYAATDGEDLVLEGYHIEPAFIRRLPPTVVAATRALFLVRSDLAGTAAALQLGRQANDWVLQRTARCDTYDRIASMIVCYSAAINAGAAAHGGAALAMDGPFQARVAEALSIISPAVLPWESALTTRGD